MPPGIVYHHTLKIVTVPTMRIIKVAAKIYFFRNLLPIVLIFTQNIIEH